MKTAVLLVFVLPATCMAQGAGVGAARSILENQARSAAEAQSKLNTDAQGSAAQAAGNSPGGASPRAADPRVEWLRAKKLHIVKELPKTPHSADECMKPSMLKEGETGYLECWPCAVVQIINTQSVILNLSGAPILLEEYSTKGLIRNEPVRLVGPVKILELKSNPNRSGAVAELRALQFVSLEALSGKPTGATATKEAEQFRTFTDSTGKYTFSGRFIEFKEGSAHFVREDNQQPLAVKMALLSEADQQWIADELKSRREK